MLSDGFCSRTASSVLHVASSDGRPTLQRKCRYVAPPRCVPPPSRPALPCLGIRHKVGVADTPATLLAALVERRLAEVVLQASAVVQVAAVQLLAAHACMEGGQIETSEPGPKGAFLVGQKQIHRKAGFT
jgi:hypothetical protein